MNNYFLLSGVDSKEGSSALTPKGLASDRELINELEGKDQLPFSLTLVKTTVGKNGIIVDPDLTGLKLIWSDYLTNNQAWPLMSQKMKDLISDHLTGHEGIDWIKCNVTDGIETRRYFVLRFNKMLDVLDEKQTTYVPGTDSIIRPVFSLDKIRQYSVFTRPSSYNHWKITSSIYVNEGIRHAAKKSKLTELGFEKVKVS